MLSELKCERCRQLILPEDTVRFGCDGIAHVDCRRPCDLSYEERALLFRYCFDHAVATCPACLQDFRQSELGADLLANRTHLCPRCRVDLTARLREHVYNCTMLPSEVRRRAREARAAAVALVKASGQLLDTADVLVREAEAALIALRRTMQRTSGG